MKKHVLIIAAIAVAAMAGCKKDENPPAVDEKGLTADIHKIIPEKYLEEMVKSGFVVHGGNTPPQIEGVYLANPLELVANRTSSSKIAEHWDMYVTYYAQNNKNLTIKADYRMDGDKGEMTVSGQGGFIVGKDNKFTIFIDCTREQGGYKAKTVEVFSGEIAAGGISNYQWGVLMVEDNGDPLNIWIGNGEFYLKKDKDGFSERIK